jgi:hypothetical protein
VLVACVEGDLGYNKYLVEVLLMELFLPPI